MWNSVWNMCVCVLFKSPTGFYKHSKSDGSHTRLNVPVQLRWQFSAELTRLNSEYQETFYLQAERKENSLRSNHRHITNNTRPVGFCVSSLMSVCSERWFQEITSSLCSESFPNYLKTGKSWSWLQPRNMTKKRKFRQEIKVQRQRGEDAKTSIFVDRVDIYVQGCSLKQNTHWCFKLCRTGLFLTEFMCCCRSQYEVFYLNELTGSSVPVSVSVCCPARSALCCSTRHLFVRSVEAPAAESKHLFFKDWIDGRSRCMWKLTGVTQFDK